MKKDCKIYIKMFTKEDLSADELVDAFRNANVFFIEDYEDTQQRIARCVICSDNPIMVIGFFQKTLDELRNVVGSQHKTLQELK